MPHLAEETNREIRNPQRVPSGTETSPLAARRPVAAVVAAAQVAGVGVGAAKSFRLGARVVSQAKDPADAPEAGDIVAVVAADAADALDENDIGPTGQVADEVAPRALPPESTGHPPSAPQAAPIVTDQSPDLHNTFVQMQGPPVASNLAVTQQQQPVWQEWRELPPSLLQAVSVFVGSRRRDHPRQVAAEPLPDQRQPAEPKQPAR